MRKVIFYIALVAVAVVLVLLSFKSKPRSEAVVAQVESQRTAVSFHRPVRVKKIHVIPGQDIEEGQLLIEVERPDLVLDEEKRVNEMDMINAEIRKKEVDRQSKIGLLEVETRSKISQLQSEIDLLTAEIEADRDVRSQVSRLVYGDSVKITPDTLSQMKVSSLQKEIEYLRRHLQSEKARIIRQHEEDQILLNIRKGLVQQEIDALKEEKESLVQSATFSGTIGNVYVQLEELVPPYKTLVSIYETHPTIIKAFMNTGASVALQLGEQVDVESVNREYSISGEVIEIGSRIVSFPEQIRTSAQDELWGQEVFIRIPSDNQFLNGEKVFVFSKQN